MLTCLHTAVHSKRSEIKRFKFNLMIPVNNPLFCALLLVFVWPHIWRHGTPRQKEVYTHLFASVGPMVMSDLEDKLDPVVYAEIKPSWDDLQRHARIAYKMEPENKFDMDWVQDIPGFCGDPDEYKGARYGRDGDLLPSPLLYSSRRTFILL